MCVCVALYCILLNSINKKGEKSKKHLYNSILESENPSPTTKRKMDDPDGKAGQAKKKSKRYFIVNVFWIFVSNQSLLLLKAKKLVSLVCESVITDSVEGAES